MITALNLVGSPLPPARPRSFEEQVLLDNRIRKATSELRKIQNLVKLGRNDEAAGLAEELALVMRDWENQRT